MTFQQGNTFGFTSNRKHGHAPSGAQTKAYRAWQGMLIRCRYPDRAGYANYGGRGICVCDEWNPETSGCFENFLADMGAPSAGTSLDRRDNNKGYSKDNCRWATRAEQNRNQRSNILLSHEGKTQCVADWAIELGVPSLVLYKRLYRGWTPERTLGTPLKIKS